MYQNKNKKSVLFFSSIVGILIVASFQNCSRTNFSSSESLPESERSIASESPAESESNATAVSNLDTNRLDTEGFHSTKATPECGLTVKISPEILEGPDQRYCLNMDPVARALNATAGPNDYVEFCTVSGDAAYVGILACHRGTIASRGGFKDAWSVRIDNPNSADHGKYVQGRFTRLVCPESTTISSNCARADTVYTKIYFYR